jgi:hypothetical protein
MARRGLSTKLEIEVCASPAGEISESLLERLERRTPRSPLSATTAAQIAEKLEKAEQRREVS